MTLIRNIAHYATEAVLAYGRIAGIAEVNEVPEIFLGGFIARRLHEELGCNAHIERKYLTMAHEYGIRVDRSLIDLMGGHAADVVVYNETKPSVIIEIKKYDERGSDSLIRRDIEKMRNLSSLISTGSLQTIIAVLVTDTVDGKKYDERAAKLGTGLGVTFDGAGPVQICKNGSTEWCWQFVCGSFDASAVT